MNEGVEHHAAGRLGEAVERYSRVVERAPHNGTAWRLLGVLALQTGDNAAARSFLERAVRVDQKDADAYAALGSLEESDREFDAAYAAYKAAYQLDATQQTALAGLMRVALGLGHASEVVSLGELALANNMSDAGLLRTLGAARLKVRDYGGAAEALLASLRIAPHADAYANLGAAYVHLHRVDESISACVDGLALDPSHAGAANNLGIAYKAADAFPAALGAFERAVALGSEDAHVNIGTTRLLLGDYLTGWPEYGWVSAERRANPAFVSLPMWDGQPAPGRRLLVWPEQGVGDTIQMARFLPRARALVDSITLACPSGTADLLRTVAGVDSFIDTGNETALDDFDLWLPTIRLPVIFDIARESISCAPYLRADPRRIERFRPRLAAPGLRVGLVWSGNPNFAWNDLRSCGLAELEIFRTIPGITWFALQQGAASAERDHSRLALVPINAEVSDFADTAAIIAQLDLVISVDTSVAHLAGALGRPAWVLLCSRPDWRWQFAGEVSPWYPGLRLFRQPSPGAWAPVVATVTAALAEFARLAHAG